MVNLYFQGLLWVTSTSVQMKRQEMRKQFLEEPITTLRLKNKEQSIAKIWTHSTWVVQPVLSKETALSVHVLTALRCSWPQSDICKTKQPERKHLRWWSHKTSCSSSNFSTNSSPCRLKFLDLSLLWTGPSEEESTSINVKRMVRNTRRKWVKSMTWMNCAISFSFHIKS